MVVGEILRIPEREAGGGGMYRSSAGRPLSALLAEMPVDVSVHDVKHLLLRFIEDVREAKAGPSRMELDAIVQLARMAGKDDKGRTSDSELVAFLREAKEEAAERRDRRERDMTEDIVVDAEEVR